MNAIERIKGLKVNPFDLSEDDKKHNATIDKVLAILEEEKPVDPCAFAEWIVESDYTSWDSNGGWKNVQNGEIITVEQLLEIYKQTLK